MDMLKLFKNYPKKLELVTELSPSSTTHPILQTVMDQCVDLVNNLGCGNHMIEASPFNN